VAANDPLFLPQTREETQEGESRKKKKATEKKKQKPAIFQLNGKIFIRGKEEKGRLPAEQRPELSIGVQEVTLRWKRKV